MNGVLPALLLAIAAGSVFAYGYTRIMGLEERTQQLQEELASSTAQLEQRTAALENDSKGLRNSVDNLSGLLAESHNELQARFGGFEQIVGQISGTVETLEKLSKTDAELLQKYSKVYFLNEHYVPERLARIEPQFMYDENKPGQIHASVWPHLQNLLRAANSSNIELHINSAYRSFDEQSALKSQYKVTYGTGTANQFSADQGYSEHQLGTTVDFTTTGLNGQLDGFGSTPAYQWLQSNAHRYGFTLSYPPNNPSYVFEPWHWRFVGVKLATDLHNQSKYFYDLDQREIDEYLVNIFE